MSGVAREDLVDGAFDGRGRVRAVELTEERPRRLRAIDDVDAQSDTGCRDRERAWSWRPSDSRSRRAASRSRRSVDPNARRCGSVRRADRQRRDGRQHGLHVARLLGIGSERRPNAELDRARRTTCARMPPPPAVTAIASQRAGATRWLARQRRRPERDAGRRARRFDARARARTRPAATASRQTMLPQLHRGRIARDSPELDACDFSVSEASQSRARLEDRARMPVPHDDLRPRVQVAVRSACRPAFRSPCSRRGLTIRRSTSTASFRGWSSTRACWPRPTTAACRCTSAPSSWPFSPRTWTSSSWCASPGCRRSTRARSKSRPPTA